MTPERWQQLKELLNQALELPPGDRTPFLANRSADAELVREVESLLALEDEVGDFIETPVLARWGGGAGSGDRAGQRVGPWQLVEEIGHGGMGTVYRARRADDSFEKTVALKVLKRGLDTDEVVRRFRAERQILAGLDHPNIARLLDGGTTEDGLPFLVMEHVDGVPIDVYCRELGLPVEERLGLFLQVCSAVQLAHRNLVVHRDLKPSNILVTAEGVPKLLDFGIAKLLDPTRGEGLMTLAGWQFLTPEYASPEQAAGQPVTTATDVYSLGVLLYQLLADRRPYDVAERTLDGLTQALRAGDPPRPSTVCPPQRASRLRGNLDHITLAALRHEPERRYGTADQLADDLHRHLEGLPVRATPDSLRYRAGKFIRRHRLPVAAAAAFLVLIVGFSVVTWVFAQQAVASEELAQTATETLIGIIERADPDSSPGAELTVKELFDSAREEIDSREDLASQPELKAVLLRLIGRIYLALGEPLEARGVLEEGLSLGREVFGPSSPWVAETQNDLAESYQETNDFEEAKKHLEQVLEVLRRHHSPSDPPVLQLRSNLALVHDELGETELAEAEYREILEEWRADGDPDEEAGIHHNLGGLLVDQGRYDEGLEPIERAYAFRRSSPTTKPSELAKTMSVLASALAGTGRLEEAEGIARERLALSEELYPEGHPDTVFGLNNLALILRDLGELDEAESLLLEAARMLGEKPSGARATLLRNLASVRIDQGELEAAEADLAEAGEFFSENPENKSSLYAGSILGSLRRAQGRFEEAEALLLASYRSLLDDEAIVSSHNYVQDTRRRLVRLYEDWEKPALAAHYAEGEAPQPLSPALPAA